MSKQTKLYTYVYAPSTPPEAHPSLIRHSYGLEQLNDVEAPLEYDACSCTPAA